MEGTFGDSWENSWHRISPELWFLVKKAGNIYAIFTKLIAKKTVSEKDLPDDIEKIDRMGHEHFDGPKIMET